MEHANLLGHTKPLSYKQQLELFEERGMTGINLFYKDDSDIAQEKLNQQLRSLETIGYYRLKDYSYTFVDHSTKKYSISFDNLVKRYYQDRHLKQYVLQAIEDIEASINTQISYVLGKNYGAFGYTNFYKWCQNSGKNPYLHKKIDKYFLQKEELSFLSTLQYSAKKSGIKDVETFENESSSVFPTVWLMTNLLTMGQSIHIIKLMNNRNRKEIADSFNLPVNQLIQYLECLNLIRNICCHNGNLVDIRLKTRPSIPNSYSNFMLDSQTNRLILPIIVILQFMKTLNPRYQFKNLRNSIIHLAKLGKCDHDRLAQAMGFRDFSTISSIFQSN